MGKATVYFTNELTPEAVVKMYRQLGIDLPGKVAVKVHSGEDGNQNYLRPEFMKPVIDAVNGTVVECNTAYGGARNETPKHIELMKKHHWSDLFDVDIMDAEGPDVQWPVENGKVLKVNYLGKNIENYDSMLVLIGSMALGLIHLNTGMVIGAVKKIKAGDVAGAIWEEGALWVTLVGIILYVLKVGNIAGVPVVLVIGILMILFGGTRGAKGFGKLTSIFGTVYNTVTGWFGDILSYSRIMALMLAGSVIATVFNTIGAIANNLIFFFVIFIIGHSLNFALNLLGCYVHDLRLQCLEYFGKFYTDGGRAFAPLRIKTKYYDTVEQ